ncbi:MAG: hypothetical protein IJB83_01625 [Bacilli bacterium]|nr:hypothetical protein [Bacilli bacterium]
MVKKIGIYLLGLFLCILSVLAFLGIYKNIMTLLNPDKIVSFLGYTDYIVVNDGYNEYDKGDLALIKLNDVYNDSDYILFYYQSNVFFGKIINNNGNIYNIDNNYEIYREDIIGKATFKISNFEGLYNILTSPFIILFILISTGFYFYLTVKGKIKEEI